MNNKPKILIIDDEKGLRIGTQRLLEEEGYDVTAVETGEEGIRIGTRNDFDIAVIDLKMPDYDGLEVLQKIKTNRPLTVCFIATAFASYETAIQSTRLGAFGYIPKPFTPDEFLYQIEQGIKQRKLILESEKLKKEREENLLELASEKSRLNAIIKSISDGVLVINKNGELAYYNYAALKFLDLSDIKIGDKILPLLNEKIVQIVEKIFSSETILLKSYTTQIELKPDNELIVEAAATPIPHPDGTLAGVVIVLSNITEFKKIELIKSQFVSMVAHELKAPLAAVQGYLNLLTDEKINLPEEKRKDYLNRSLIRLKSLSDLVNDLLDISRMELKTKFREIEDVDIRDIIKNLIQFFEIDIKKRGLNLEINIAENLPTIKADQNEISRLITNLLSNAIKYNKDNGKIIIDISSSTNYLEIKITDTGIGLKPEEKSKLFNEFFRAKNEKTRGISGTGLGLSIVKKIVDSYYGKIDVVSEFGKGTTFIINLPINI
ncbi:ATP-binding response regulator [Rosettibacter firmus]|uniref:ATP-binding response regulator n=1 Tax=Rosettibacter firmus TaxID=3111522 RepID=UPI00336C1A3B